MSKPISAGILVFKRLESGLEVFLVHPGGPYWTTKDAGAWSIPKGLVEKDEDLLAAAKREFEEETSFVLSGEPIELGTVIQKSGKTVHAWAVQGNFDPSLLVSNRIDIEWPPKSGKQINIPEVDKACYFDFETALTKLNPAQAEFVKRLAEKLNA